MQPKKKKQKLQVGILGTGFGLRVHLPAFRLDSRYEVRALWSRNFEKSLAAAAAEKIPLVHYEWRDMLNDPDLDVLSFALPPALQGEILEIALHGEKGLFVEKPLCANITQARALKTLAKREPAKLAPLMIDFEFTELPTWMSAKKWLESGRLGKIREVIGLWRIPTPPNVEFKPSWKDDVQQGGGLLKNFGSHVFQYLEWFLGPLENIRCENAASVILHADTQAGVPVSYVMTRTGEPRAHRLQFFCERGTLELENLAADYASGFCLKLSNSSSSQKILAREKMSANDGRIHAVAILTRRLADWCLHGRKTTPSLSEGLRVEELLELARPLR